MCSATSAACFGLILLRHFLGVAAGGFRRLEFLVLDRDELGAEALDLLLGRRPHVGRGDDGAEPARGRDRLQAGDAGAHDEDFCSRDGTGRGHHHRQRPAIFGGGVDDGAVAGKVGLARQHIHDLGAGDARQKLHGEGDDAGLGHAAQRFFMAIRVHDGDDDGALLQVRKLGRQRPPHLEHDIGAVHRALGHGGSGAGIVRVENSRFQPGARLDRNLGAKADHLFDGLGRGRDPRLARIDLGSNRNFHDASVT